MKNRLFSLFLKLKKTIFPPLLGTLFGMILVVIIYEYVAFYFKGKIHLDIFNLIAPILFAYLSIMITITFFKSIASQSINMCMFSIVLRLATTIRRSPIIELDYLILIIMIFAMLLVISVYVNLLRFRYDALIEENINKLKKYKFKNLRIEMMYQELSSLMISTPDLWGVIKSRQNLIKSYLKSISSSLESIDNKPHLESKIDEMNFLLPGGIRFLCALFLSLGTSICVISSGIVFIQ